MTGMPTLAELLVMVRAEQFRGYVGKTVEVWPAQDLAPTRGVVEAVGEDSDGLYVRIAGRQVRFRDIAQVRHPGGWSGAGDG